MIVSDETKVASQKVEHPQAKNAFMKVLVSPAEGWEGYVMRLFELEKEGYTPKHTHDWPHINYIVEGIGTLFLDGKENEIGPGSYAYIPSGELHQFKNTGDANLKLICIVPEEGHQ